MHVVVEVVGGKLEGWLLHGTDSGRPYRRARTTEPPMNQQGTVGAQKWPHPVLPGARVSTRTWPYWALKPLQSVCQYGVVLDAASIPKA